MALTPTERQRAWRARHPGAAAQAQRRYRAEHPDRVKLAQQLRYAKNRQAGKDAALRWKTAHPDRKKLMDYAGTKLRRAIKRGDITRPTTCSQCSRTAFIEAAHIDYSRPLDVIWLCRPCHRTWDKHSPKT